MIASKKIGGAVALLCGVFAISCAHPDYQTRVTNVREGGEGYDIERVPIDQPPPAPTTPLPPGDTKTHETGVRKAESDLQAALIAHNADAAADLLEDRFILTTPDGETQSKADFVDSIRNGRLVVTSEELADERVEEYGNAAVMTGVIKAQATRDGNDISGGYRFIDTWIWTKGQWRKAAAVYMKAKE